MDALKWYAQEIHSPIPFAEVQEPQIQLVSADTGLRDSSE
jgi:hypothetical protein